MPFLAGDRLGRYEIVRSLSTGETDELYHARDVRLRRDVALKVLPDEHRFDALRVARLEGEAQTLAAVNHPNIATFYGIEKGRGQQALVMELVEGETLAERIAKVRSARGHGLPIGEATAIARQVAEALEAAHDQGIVHLDLKPADIKVRADGTIKLLGFGLADASPLARPGSQREVDVLAFGRVLHEMLGSPDLDALPREVPQGIRRLLRRTLTADPRRRLRDMADARIELSDVSDEAERPAPSGDGRGARLVLACVGFAAAAVATPLLWSIAPEAAVPTPPVRRFELKVGASVPLRDVGASTRPFALSPDGTRLAYLTDGGVALRSLDRLDPVVLPVTALDALFFSADGQWLAGLSDGVRKVAVTGGPAVRLADSGPGAMAAWGDGGILLANVRGLFRVPPEGGPPKRLPIDFEPNEQATFPEPLPGGQSLLFTVIPTVTQSLSEAPSALSARIEAVDLRTSRRTVVLRGGGRPRYLPGGHLAYSAGDSVYVVPFDPARLEVRGEPVRSPDGAAAFTVSDDGTLVYALGLSRKRRELVWVDRNGREERLGTPVADYAYPRLSPDGKRIALDVFGPDRDIWMWDIERRIMERFTLDPTENSLPAWTRDGTKLVVSSAASGIPNLYLQEVDGSGGRQRLLESPNMQRPFSVAPDGRLLFVEAVPTRGRDVLALSLDGSRAVEPLLTSAANEIAPEVSPDGRWLAFASDESGRYEVYVRPYPQTAGGRWQVSASGGRQPVWSKDGRELYYRDFGGAVVMVPVRAGPSFQPGVAVTLLPPGRTYMGYGSGMGARTFDVSADGTRFLMVKTLDAAREPSFVVVQNWLANLTGRTRSR